MKKVRSNFKLIGGLLAGMIIGGATVVGANQAIQAMQNTEIKISLNGEVQNFKDETTGETQYPITYNNRTYLPLRNVANLAGLEVDYDIEQNMAILKKDNLNYEIAKKYYEDSNLVFVGTNYDIRCLLSKDGKQISFIDKDNKKVGPTINYNGFNGNVVSAINIIQGDPSAYEFPIYILNDKGEVYEGEVGGGELKIIDFYGQATPIKVLGIACKTIKQKKVVPYFNGLYSAENVLSYQIYAKLENGEEIILVEKDLY